MVGWFHWLGHSVGGVGVVLGWVGPVGCPWWGLLVLVTSYVAVWHARGAPPPLREGVSWFVPFNSLALAGWALCLKKKINK